MVRDYRERHSEKMVLESILESGKSGSRYRTRILGSRPKYSGMADFTALVLVPLDRWRMGGPIYVIRMIDRWAWLAHGRQMYCFYHFYVVECQYCIIVCCVRVCYLV